VLITPLGETGTASTAAIPVSKTDKVMDQGGYMTVEEANCRWFEREQPSFSPEPCRPDFGRAATRIVFFPAWIVGKALGQEKMIAGAEGYSTGDLFGNPAVSLANAAISLGVWYGLYKVLTGGK
jgi:hypothetical protein